ncbi:hypothetical protein KQI89_14620 [Clostridium sp. MSJ-4]|uniref:Uncharacterized protein n=1 Tax=Clostridium simiarum TaxID=2841506 RepID=A0ABS6F389_9CLOT|nr:hypothetical protein [Clostridium simiarum]MBU5592982.1 hypothetical protein [Clostridium simiarum]
MNKKITPLSVISFILIFIPWTIVFIRQNSWALESPVAEITIAIYSIFIIAAFIFSLVLYAKKKQRDILASIAVIVNGIYAAGASLFICISIPNWIK